MASVDTDQVRSNINQLISKQRLLRLVDGAKFFRYTPKGQRVKDKYWYCKLSPNHRFLHYGDIEASNIKPQLDDLPNKINVTDIKRLVVGKDCSKKSPMEFAFTVIYDHEDNLNFNCGDRKTFCHWIDGMNVLLKCPMDSEEFHKELHMLTRIEEKIHSMD